MIPGRGPMNPSLGTCWHSRSSGRCPLSCWVIAGFVGSLIQRELPRHSESIQRELQRISEFDCCQFRGGMVDLSRSRDDLGATSISKCVNSVIHHFDHITGLDVCAGSEAPVIYFDAFIVSDARHRPSTSPMVPGAMSAI